MQTLSRYLILNPLFLFVSILGAGQSKVCATVLLRGRDREPETESRLLVRLGFVLFEILLQGSGHPERVVCQ